MALIKVGIHDNLVLSKETKINEHGTLELVIETKEDPDALLNAFENNETLTSMKSSIRFYPPNMEDFDKNKKSAADIGKDLLKMRYQLSQYALLYGTKDEVDAAIGGLKMFSGLGIPPEDYAKALTQLNQEEFLKKVVTNLATLFIKFLQSKDAFNGKIAFRQKFLRQSKDKNYATIPTSDFDVWIEPMTVPKEQSKIAYSEWEKKNGKDNPNPIASDAGQATAEDAKKAADLFKAPDTEKAQEDSPNKPNLFTKKD